MADVKKPDDDKTITENTHPADETKATEENTQANEQLAIDSDTPPPDKNAEEAAALAQAEKPPNDDKIVTYDFTAKSQTAQSAEQAAQTQKPPEANPPEEKPRRGRPPKPEQGEKPTPKPQGDKTGKDPKPKAEKPPKGKQAAGARGDKSKQSPGKAQTPQERTEALAKAAIEKFEAPPPPPEPKEAPRTGEQETIVYINLSELHPFKDHPFQVKQDAEMLAMVESVKDKGVTQPAIVRPREDGGYELVSGHRRHMASELSNYTNMPCIVRNLTDEQAITQMVEDNTNQRENILPSERGAALKMQLEAIKRQGARESKGNGEKGQRSNEVVADRNKMTVKQVQRYIKLTELVPDLQKMVDDKKIAFTPAVELAHIKPKNQNYIAVAIEGNQSAPSLSQAQRLRELDQKNVLNPDMIDGIMLEEKKEVDKVILSSKELSQYFGSEKTPREMKNAIIKLLDDNKAKNPPELGKDKQAKPPER